MKIIIKIDPTQASLEKGRRKVLELLMANLDGRVLHTVKNLSKYEIINQNNKIAAKIKIK